ncbi:hypothetical protein MPSEU_000645500 [Mayamaea pseudoterrestris]|nr:hypothetical protein MPSEU_000645500 [Mayamaea pseudoterrestris]
MNISRLNMSMMLLRLMKSSRGFTPSSVASLLLSSRRGIGTPLTSTRSYRPCSFLQQSDNRSPPPEFTIVDNDNEDRSSNDEETDKFYTPYVKDESGRPSKQFEADDSVPDFSIDFGDDGDIKIQAAKPKAFTKKQRAPTPNDTPTSRSASSSRASRPQQVSPKSSWMDRNDAFTGADSSASRTFREDFRGTRVFVMNLAPETSWQDLKDHFRLAGEVVFASVSSDPETGASKGHGIVQYETTDMAAKAIKVMPQHLLHGATLAVRKDLQEGKAGATLSASSSRGNIKGPTPPTKWKCADESSPLSPHEETSVRVLIKERDFARRRKDYALSDEIREQLKKEHGVHIDDRLKMWWTNIDGKSIPQTIQDIKGSGRWGEPKGWQMIPTTQENDACVNVDLVNGLLAQRDVARREKDFATADALLEQARNSPDGDLSLRIHDESRTWRIWTDEKPDFGAMRESFSPRPERKSPAEQCIAITEEFAPERVEEIKQVLEQFPGREYNILKKLKRQFNV